MPCTFRFPAVEEADLSEKELKKLPVAITTISSLTGLYFEDNEFKTLPPGNERKKIDM